MMCVDLSSLLDANHVSVWLIAISRQPSSRAGCADCHFLVFVGLRVQAQQWITCIHTPHTHILLFWVLLLYHVVFLSLPFSYVLVSHLFGWWFSSASSGSISHTITKIPLPRLGSVLIKRLRTGYFHKYVVAGEFVM